MLPLYPASPPPSFRPAQWTEEGGEQVANRVWGQTGSAAGDDKGRRGERQRQEENMQTRGKKVREISENEQQERGGEGMKDAQEEGGEQVAQKKRGEG